MFEVVKHSMISSQVSCRPARSYRKFSSVLFVPSISFDPWKKSEFSLVRTDKSLKSCSRLRNEIICWPQLLSGLQTFNSVNILNFVCLKRGPKESIQADWKMKEKVSNIR